MALRSIYEIDFDPSGKFAAFATKFAAFQKELAKVPASWMKSGDAIKGNAEELAGMAAARKLLVDLERKSSNELTKHQQAASYTARSWQLTARSTKDVAGNIAKATTQLLKWTALTGVFTGLLGAGGLYGIDRLAAGVGAGRRSAQGLGLGYGQQQAFGVNYSRLVDSGFLGNVNAALHDVSKRAALYGAGLSERDLAGGNTADVGVKLINALGKIADQTPDAQMAQVLRARGLDQIVSLEEFQRLKAAGPAERAEIGRAYGRDVDPLSLSNRTQKAWQDLEVQLTRAGKEIENVFVTGLVELTPGLKKLSAALTEDLDALLKSPELKKGINDLADYFASDKFKADLKALSAGVHTLASIFGFLLKTPTQIVTEATGGRSFGQMVFDATPDFLLTASEKKKRQAAAGNATTNHVVDYFVSKGYSREAATGIASGLYYESDRTFDPKAFNGAGGGRGAQGVGQWRGARLNTFEAMYGKKMMDATLDEQLAYVEYELSKGKDFGARRAGDLLRSGKLGASQSAEAFINLYERPGAPGAREARSAGVLAESLMRKDATSYVGNTPPSQSIVSSGKSDSDNLVNKFSRVLDDMSRRNGPGGQQTINVAITPAPGGNPIPITQQAAAQ